MTRLYTHPTAIVESTRIGEGTRIWAFTHVATGVSIGAECNIGEHCFVETGAIIGNRVTIKNGNEIWDGVRIADGVFIGPNVSFTNDLRPRSPRLPQAASRYKGRDWLRHTVINDGASIGAAAVILAGTTIGEFAMVGAGSIVTRDVPPYALVLGAPARRVGWVCQCGSQLQLSDTTALCRDCGRAFIRNKGTLRIKSRAVAAA